MITENSDDTDPHPESWDFIAEAAHYAKTGSITFALVGVAIFIGCAVARWLHAF